MTPAPINQTAILPRPLLSVVMPVYNGEAFLADAIDHVMAQNYRPLECIVVDDGSADRTGDIAATFVGHRYRQPHRYRRKSKYLGHWLRSRRLSGNGGNQRKWQHPDVLVLHPATEVCDRLAGGPGAPL